jgi:hypothetical protein
MFYTGLGFGPVLGEYQAGTLVYSGVVWLFEFLNNWLVSNNFQRIR